MSDQCRKIVEMCRDGQFHCQNEFRARFIFSPHKRRIEIEGRRNRKELVTGPYEFETRKCIHGFKNEYDYRMFPNPLYVPSKVETRDEAENRLLQQAIL